MNPPETAEAQQTPRPDARPPSGASPTRRIGDIVVDLGYTSREAVEAAVEKGREIGQPVGRVLVERGTVTPNQLAHALAERFGLDHVDLNAFPVDMGAVGLISPDMVRRHHALPVAFVDDSTLLVAMADPANVLAMDDFKMSTGLDLRRAVASLEDILAMAGRHSDLADAVGEAIEDEEEDDKLELRESADDAPVVKLVHSVIADAVERGASDIHFDPRRAGGEMKVRFRVDGVVADATTVPKKLVRGLVSRVKIMADLDIAERRLPAGRPRRAEREQAPGGPARGHAADRRRRVDRHPHPRQGGGRDGAREARHAAGATARSTSAPSIRRTAPCS